MVLYKDFQPCETWKSIVFFFTCVWYRQSAGYASLESDDFSCITTKFSWSPPWGLAIFFWSAPPPPPTHWQLIGSQFFLYFPHLHSSVADEWYPLCSPWKLCDLQNPSPLFNESEGEGEGEGEGEEEEAEEEELEEVLNEQRCFPFWTVNWRYLLNKRWCSLLKNALRVIKSSFENNFTLGNCCYPLRPEDW